MLQPGDLAVNTCLACRDADVPLRSPVRAEVCIREPDGTQITSTSSSPSSSTLSSPSPSSSSSSPLSSSCSPACGSPPPFPSLARPARSKRNRGIQRADTAQKRHGTESLEQPHGFSRAFLSMRRLAVPPPEVVTFTTKFGPESRWLVSRSESAACIGIVLMNRSTAIRYGSTEASGGATSDESAACEERQSLWSKRGQLSNDLAERTLPTGSRAGGMAWHGSKGPLSATPLWPRVATEASSRRQLTPALTGQA